MAPTVDTILAMLVMKKPGARDMGLLMYLENSVTIHKLKQRDHFWN